ncbi:MAG: hypothetical protein NVS1B13_17510 [Flavisolibacter sp.]
MGFEKNINFTLEDGTPVKVIPIPGYYKLIFEFEKSVKELVWPENLCIQEAKNFQVLERFEFEGLNILLDLMEASKSDKQCKKDDSAI